MEWTAQNNSPIFYSVNIFPLASFAYSVSGLIGRLQVKLLYNILYNMSIIANLCGQNISDSYYFIELHYGESIQTQDQLWIT